MTPITCPKCGRPSDAEEACPDCSRVANGVAPAEAQATIQQPVRPAGVPDGRLPPELQEWARQTFNLEEFMAGLREVERTGGRELKDFIHELEQEAAPRE